MMIPFKRDEEPFKIQDFVTGDYLGVLCLDAKTLQDIYENSGKLAEENEFQVHYWFLNLRKINEDGTIIDIQIPTVVYNYEQEVSFTSIDFQLEDISKISDSLEEVANQKAKQILLNPKLKEYIKNHNLIVSNVALGTLHRHP